MTSTVWTRSAPETPWYRARNGAQLPLADAEALASALRLVGREAQVQAEVEC